jgi:hypothetical protein
MNWLYAILAVVFTIGSASVVVAFDDYKTVVQGDWSEPVFDSGGYALSGRLIIATRMREDGLRDTAVFIELKDANDSIGESLQLYCDFGKSDFREEYSGGLKATLSCDGAPVNAAAFPFSGAVPKSEWIVLPEGGRIRLRTSPFGIARENALAIAPDLGTMWVISDDDPKEYILSSDFTIDPPEDGVPLSDGHIWQGKITLPSLRVIGQAQEE